MRFRPFCKDLQLIASRRTFSSSNKVSTGKTNDIAGQRGHPITHFIFGANTDIGKTVLSAALIRASVDKDSAGSTTTTNNKTHYIKPLQCGGSDEGFVRKHAPSHLSSATTLFRWETPASPHFAARFEKKPVSDKEVAESLNGHLDKLETDIEVGESSSIWIETAGGVMSPSSSSPQNQDPHHSMDAASGWGWVPQADLYKSFQDRSSVVLIGDGRLGGISSTLTALEALMHRNYTVGGILLIRGDDCGDSGVCDPNLQALQEYISCHPLSKEQTTMKSHHSSLFSDPEKSILSLPMLPPEPEPLDEWYASSDVQGPMTSFVQDHLFQSFSADIS